MDTEDLIQENPNHLEFDSPESQVNCLRLLISWGHNETTTSEMDNPCLYLSELSGSWDNGMEGVERGEFMNSWWLQILVQFLYGILCFIGLAGNALVIYVVVRFTKMQTMTNFYIVNLAISDVCFLVGIPFMVATLALGYWPFGKIVCKAYFTTTSTSQITSSMFLLIISADRYLAVCHPISSPKWRTPLIAKTVALTAWTLSAVLMIPIFMYANTLEIDNKVHCNIFWPSSETWTGETMFIIYFFVLGFALPLILIVLFYVPTFGQQKSQNRTHIETTDSSDIQQAQGQSSRTIKETKLVLAVIIVHFLCWSPYWISQMAFIFMPLEDSYSETMMIVFLVSGVLSYARSTMNPILYAFLSDDFKNSFKSACTCASRKEINPTLNSILPRNKSSNSPSRQGNAGTTMETTIMITTVVPSGTEGE